MSAAFPPDTLDGLRTARTVVVETSKGPDRPVHETVIWIVVDREDRVLVRSVRGGRGRWFRELVAHPNGALHVGGTRIAVHAVPAVDADRIAACTAALSMKYRTSRGSLASMVRDEVLDATLELHPA
jgi:hypothetical protein